MVNHDPLTRLPNRSLLNDRLGQAIEAAHQGQRVIAVLLLNIDRLQRVNDSIGHDAGDLLLREMAQRLLLRLQPGDTLARIGSDEFVLVLSHVDDNDDINAAAQQMLDTVAAPCQLLGHEVVVTASVGIALFPLDGVTASDLIKNADTALSHVKNSGRNSFRYFTSEMNTRALHWMALEHRLRNALGRAEFSLFYQPQVRLADMQVCGAEALIRWRSAELGMISPAEFIPLAEDSGLIVEIGEWVIRSACAQNKAWQDAGLRALPVAVNVSAHQITAGTLPAIVKSALLHSGMEARYLSIELTESVLMQEAELAMAQIAELRGLGVAVALDDFGTGYSSLSYLSRFALDKLKIDQSFVRNITDDAKSAAIAKATIALALGLGITVVAEGVETGEQLDYLDAAGCDEVQGYFFSRPLAAEEFVVLLVADGVPAD
nr:EAL domain-containing protein [Massilia sp. H27-R4]